MGDGVCFFIDLFLINPVLSHVDFGHVRKNQTPVTVIARKQSGLYVHHVRDLLQPPSSPVSSLGPIPANGFAGRNSRPPKTIGLGAVALAPLLSHSRRITLVACLAFCGVAAQIILAAVSRSGAWGIPSLVFSIHF